MVEVEVRMWYEIVDNWCGVERYSEKAEEVVRPGFVGGLRTQGVLILKRFAASSGLMISKFLSVLDKGKFTLSLAEIR